jgi:LuxR family transcriptional regulator, maltose regulon positive regulatory protein
LAVAPRGEPPPGAGSPLLETRFQPPADTGTSVRRERLIALLADPASPPVTALLAPPGYGKTTVLATWMALESRPVAWLTLTSLDNDPVHLMAYLVAAYAHAGPIEPGLTGPLPAGADRLFGSTLPRLLANLAAWPVPAMLVLDDIHRIVEQDALDLLSVLLDRLPGGFGVALAGRSSPALPFGRLRAHRLLREIATPQLALDADETAELARLAGVTLTPQEAQDLTIRTEGWAAGIYLSVLGSASAGDRAVPGSGSGADRYIADYLRSEVGRGLGADDVAFLTRTSVLETVTPGAAAAVSGLDGAAERLERLAASNLLIRRADGGPAAYRYHNILREYLRTELDRREPAAAASLHARAAEYHAATGSYEAAVEHALASRDLDAAARYLSVAILPMYQTGQSNLLMHWLDRFSVADLERAPILMAFAAWLYLLEGHTERAEVLADIVERKEPDTLGVDGPRFAVMQAILRATMGRHGYTDLIATSTRVFRDAEADAQWRSVGGALLGVAHVASSHLDADAAEAVLAETLGIASPAARGVRMSALALRAALRLRVNDVAGAAAYAAEARDVVASIHDATILPALMVHGISARILALTGDVAGARETLVRAQLVRPLATHASPWQSLPALLDLARAYLALSDPGGAQTVLRQAEDIVRKRPGLGPLVDELLDLRTRLLNASSVLAGSSTLTNAELRVLPFLPTYLSFEEIGERLGVSRNTVKTHAMSIYGKLWASSRGEAVERAVELGLLEPYPVLERRDGRRDERPG